MPQKQIWVDALDKNLLTKRFGKVFMRGLPSELEPLAVIYRDSYQVPDGILVRNRRTGLFSHFFGGSLRGLDQRIARRAYDAMILRADREEREAAEAEQAAETEIDATIEAIAHEEAEVDADEDANREAESAADLAEAVKKWLADAHLPVSRGAQLLGLSKRTLEGIVQGRGFRYSRLIYLAIAAFD